MYGTTSLSRKRPDGFSLVEILIVIMILGILATVSVLAFRGTTDQAHEKSCANDAKTLYTSVEAYFVDHSGRTIAETGVGPDRYERTLVDADILSAVSTNYDIDEDGELTATTTGVCS